MVNLVVSTGGFSVPLFASRAAQKVSSVPCLFNLVCSYFLGCGITSNILHTCWKCMKMQLEVDKHANCYVRFLICLFIQFNLHINTSILKLKRYLQCAMQIFVVVRNVCFTLFFLIAFQFQGMFPKKKKNLLNFNELLLPSQASSTMKGSFFRVPS